MPLPCLFLVLTTLTPSVSAAQQTNERIRPGSATIAGRVTEIDSSRPLAGVLMTLVDQNLRARLTAMTNPDGTYVFEGIAMGAYLVEADHPDYVPVRFSLAAPDRARSAIFVMPDNPRRSDVDIALVPGGTITGRVTDQHGRPLKDAMVTAGMMVDDLRYQITVPRGPTVSRTDATGEYSIRQLAAGTYRVSVTWIDAEALKAKSPVRAATSFYPGTDKSLDATPLRLARGETLRRIDVVYFRADTYTLSGHVLRGLSDGPIELYLVAGARSTRTLQVDQNGAFSATHLPAGRYTLWGRAKTVDGSEGAMSRVDIEGSDVTGLILALAPTSRVSGKIVVEDIGSPPLSAMQVAAVIADDDDRVDPIERDRAPIGADGSFELSDIFGERVFHVIGAAPNWIIDRVLHGGSEVPGVKLNGQDVRGVVIVLRRP